MGRTWDTFKGDGGEYIETPERMKNFFDDIEKVYKKYDLSIQRSHTGFSITNYDEKDIESLRNAKKNYMD